MSTIITAVILLLVTIALIRGFVVLHKRKQEKKQKARLNMLHHAGEKLGLTFSSQEILDNNLLGFDGIKQVLLVVLFGKTETIHSIRMTEVATCIINKEYEKVNTGTEKNEKPEIQLKSIDLLFSFKRNPGSFTVCFYDSNVNYQFERNALEAKAKQWESMLSKMIVTKHAIVNV